MTPTQAAMIDPDMLSRHKDAVDLFWRYYQPLGLFGAPEFIVGAQGFPLRYLPAPDDDAQRVWIGVMLCAALKAVTDQAVQAERQRCADLANSMCDSFSGQIAEAIRNGDTQLQANLAVTHKWNCDGADTYFMSTPLGIYMVSYASDSENTEGHVIAPDGSVIGKSFNTSVAARIVSKHMEKS